MANAAASVLIVGAGPTGLLLALELCRHGVRPRVVDAAPGPSPLSRALAVHARTLELLDRHGLAGQFVARGERVAAVALRVSGRPVAQAPLGDIGQAISPFPFVLIVSQDQTEQLLREALVGYGVEIEWHTPVTGLTLAEGGPVVTLAPVDKAPETVRPAYVVGCDGAHSVVRHALQIGFPGGTYEQTFFVADTVTEGLDAGLNQPRPLQISMAPRTFNLFFPLPGGRTRVLGLLPAGLAPAAATFESVRPGLEAAEKIRVTQVSWFSTYRVHHRVADHFRRGPVFLAGDAAHIHSPVGGQGMNTGLGDAVNLGWKLAAVLRHNAPAALLDTYAAERVPFARRLVATTDRAFTQVTEPAGLSAFIRTRLLPRLLPLVLRLGWVRRLMFRTVSQTSIEYPESALSEGRAGTAQAGQRLPWVPGPRYAVLRQPGWQLLSLGSAAAEARDWAEMHDVPLTETPPGPGEAPGALYLMRPDGYLGLVLPVFDAARLTSYTQRWGIGAGPA